MRQLTTTYFILQTLIAKPSSCEIARLFFLSKCGKKRAFLHDFKITKTLKILIFKSLRCGKKRIKTKKKRKRTKKNLIGSEILEKRLCLCDLPMRENSQNKIHYGWRKGNKIFVTFATDNNN